MTTLTITKATTSARGRFITSIVAEAARSQPAMPWTRGPRRAEMIARRAETARRRTA